MSAADNHEIELPFHGHHRSRETGFHKASDDFKLCDARCSKAILHRGISYVFGTMWKGGRNFWERHVVKIFVVMLLWNAVGAYWLLNYFRQMHDSWTGTLVRVYDETGFLGKILFGDSAEPRRYWEVRTSGGETKTARLYLLTWYRGKPQMAFEVKPGDPVIKERGHIDPGLDVPRHLRDRG